MNTELHHEPALPGLLRRILKDNKLQLISITAVVDKCHTMTDPQFANFMAMPCGVLFVQLEAIAEELERRAAVEASASETKATTN